MKLCLIPVNKNVCVKNAKLYEYNAEAKKESPDNIKKGADAIEFYNVFNMHK